MKLFIVACLVAVAAAGRLEHLENGYLPPHGEQSHGSSFGSSSNFGSSGFDSGLVAAKSQPSFHSGSSFNAATSNQYLAPSQGSSGFSQYTSQSYSAPQTYSAPSYQAQAPSTSYGVPSSFGSSSSFERSSGSSNFGSQGFAKSSQSGQYQALSHNQAVSQFPSASRQYLTPNVYSSQQSQIPSVSHQYLAPKVQYVAPKVQYVAPKVQYVAPNVQYSHSQSNFQNIPQQAFDEETGYHY